MPNKFDLIIIGAGPAGCSCALGLRSSGLKIALLERAVFPRDKICGDALSVDVINQLHLLSPQLQETFEKFPGKISSSGVRIFSPANEGIDIPFIHKGVNKNGYICSRLDFDNLLSQKVKEQNSVYFRENCVVENINVQKSGVLVRTAEGDYEGKVVIGADGAHSIVKKLLPAHAIERKHHSAGLRQYFEGITSFHSDGYIELYFLKDILPGYLWIFPMQENKANVGIGMLSSVVSKKRINLRELMQRMLTTHPLLKHRFERARPIETAKGHSLPLGSKKRVISGERILLLGDAAGLIDPFTGEGIGNAIRSGRIAANHLINCFHKENFSAAFNHLYDEEVYSRMWKELHLSYKLQQLCKYPWLFNYIVKKAARNKYWHQFLVDSLAETDQKMNFIKPAFYYRLFFG